MKATFKILATVIAGIACSTAFADLPQKAATRIDFNNMIDSNNSDKQQLEKTVSNKMAVEPEDSASVADQKKVLDLVDVEVGVGEDRPVVVDRRYNSVGEAVIDKSFSNVQVQLVDKKATGKGS
jgi:hypothetical protein